MRGMLTGIIFLVFFQWGFAQYNVRSEHPRLFLNQEIISHLQAKYTSNATDWARMKSNVIDPNLNRSGADILNDYIEKYNYVLAYGIAYYATGNNQYLQKAKDILLAMYNVMGDTYIQRDSGYNSRDAMVVMAVGYDWCYSVLTDQERASIRNRLITWANWIRSNAYAVYGSVYFEPGNNYSAGHMFGLMATGLAIYSEDPVNGKACLDNALGAWNEIRHFVETRLKGGDVNEGWSYGAGYAYYVLGPLALWKTAISAGDDYYAQIEWDNSLIEFMIYATLPDRIHILPQGDWARESTGLIWDMHRTVSDIISSYSESSFHQGLASYWGNEVYPVTKFHNFYIWRSVLFFNPQVAPVNYRNVEPFKSKLYVFTDSSGTGQFVQRTSWAADALWVTFRAGGMYGDHAHNGQGHFDIFKNGWLIIDSNILTRSGINIPDYAHNVVYVDPVSSHWHLPVGGDYANAPHSDIPRREFTTNYSYIWENSTRIYQTQSDNTVKNKERHFLFLPEKEIVATFDIVETFQASTVKKYRVHYFGTPTISNNLISYSNGSGKVQHYPVFPAQKNIQLLPIDDGVDNNPRRIDISYTSSQAKNYFVNLYEVVPASEDFHIYRELSVPAGTIQGANFYGGELVRNNEAIVVLFADENVIKNGFSSLTVSTLENTDMQLYIVGCLPSQNYYIAVTKNSNEAIFDIRNSNFSGASPIAASGNGILMINFSGNEFSQPIPKVKMNRITR